MRQKTLRQKTKDKKSPAWQPPETAPRDPATIILGDFGWPWPIPGVWDALDECWVIVTVQSCPMQSGVLNSWLETDTEPPAALRRWLPLPTLPPRAKNH